MPVVEGYPLSIRFAASIPPLTLVQDVPVCNKKAVYNRAPV